MLQTELAQQAVADVMQPGDIVVDATIGNGCDTLFLAQLVGPAGTVFGFDIQSAAIQETQARISEFASRVTLFHASHAEMLSHLPQNIVGSVTAVMFNLGYLPGGDKKCMTTTESTLEGLRQALKLLRPGGILTVLAYPGHRGGDEEAAAVESFLDQNAPHGTLVKQTVADKPAAPRLFIYRQ
ncbi:MAG: 16S rRNA (cytosine(1402)-N(4))-methyltransferase [Planctomycetaceae bacterium]|nr:16S rRNA (cytosine(1402)-N(4))-methyltransferase [Planctomycetaceae bacterium]